MAKLPILHINGRLYYSDKRLMEFRAVDNHHHRLSYAEVDADPDRYCFTIHPRYIQGQTVIYTRRSDRSLAAHVLSGAFERMRFADYPLTTRIAARAAVFLSAADGEREKLNAADKLPLAERQLIYDDVLCTRAARIESRERKHAETGMAEHYIDSGEPVTPYYDIPPWLLEGDEQER
jgi:hypothetical protein